MTILFVVIFILAVIFCNILQWKKTAFFMLLIVLVGYLMVGNGLIPALLLTKLQAPTIFNQDIHWKNKNIIVLLGNGTVKLPAEHNVQPTILAYARIMRTAQLYFDCIKNSNQCLIIISGGDALHTGVTEAAAYRDVLQTLGIKIADI